MKMEGSKPCWAASGWARTWSTGPACGRNAQVCEYAVATGRVQRSGAECTVLAPCEGPRGNNTTLGCVDNIPSTAAAANHAACGSTLGSQNIPVSAVKMNKHKRYFYYGSCLPCLL